MNKNLFLNTFADVKGVSIGTAKVRISKMVWDVCRKEYIKLGYTAQDLNEAYDIFKEVKLQKVFDTGMLTVEGHDYNFLKVL